MGPADAAHTMFWPGMIARILTVSAVLLLVSGGGASAQNRPPL